MIIPSTMDDYIEVKNKIDDKIAWLLGEGFLCFYSSIVC